MDKKHSQPPALIHPAICAVSVLLMAWLRLGIYGDKVFALASGLPLLLCLWNRDLRLLYGMSGALTLISIGKSVLLSDVLDDRFYFNVTVASNYLDIWLLTGVIHGIIRSRRKVDEVNQDLDRLNHELESSNEELAASNEELTAREEEISRQNEELQSQTEELEQQAEELRQQMEQSEHQSLEVQELNHELQRKDRGLQILLDSGRWLQGEMSEHLVMNGICQATVQIFDEGVHASAVAVNHQGLLQFKGAFGLGLNRADETEIDFDSTFTSLILQSRRSACIEDLSIRPDLKLPVPASSPPFRSVLGSPIWVDGIAIGSLEAFSPLPRQWSEHEFRIIEWLAAQAAVALQAIRAQLELEQKRRDAEEASVQKTRFLAAVSHDVRTPANAISLLAEFIRKCASDPSKYHQIPDLAQNLWSNARSMVDLVSDVLDIARLDSGGPDLAISNFFLRDLIDSELRQSQPLANSKGLQLRSKLPEPAIRVSSDRIKLARVLSNLVSNAIKFTEVGEIRIECEPAADGCVLLHVSDTGIGIPSEQLANVFDEFFQLRNPERNREKGAGLGLAICQRLLNSLGFKIQVKSLLGVSTTFTIEIPADCILAENGPTDLNNLEAAISPIELKDLSVLLVEDHDVVRELTAQLLTAEGAIVSTAATGRDAIRQLSTGDHKVLLLDLNLPDFDGVEILKRLQSERPASLRWILVVSADVRPDRRDQVIRLGANSLIPKPISIQMIQDAINGLPQTEPVSFAEA
jgi:signal transduction histidine kinase/ActR/RegA family two-component response regulator